MEKIDFNRFRGFERNEDIQIDTNVLYAFLDRNDPWHDTVNKLFEDHIYNELKCIHINPCIIVKTTDLLDWNKSVKRYAKKYPELGITSIQCAKIEQAAIPALKDIIERGALCALEFSKYAILQQLDLYKEFGATWAMDIALANMHGNNILTVDNDLVRKVISRSRKIPNIKKIYCTTDDHMKTDS